MALLYDILHTYGLRAQSSCLSRILWKLEGWGCFPGGVSGKEPTPANAGDSDAVSIPGLGRSAGGPASVFLTEKLHGQEEPGGL